MRKILEDDGKGRRTLEVEHKSTIRFLFIRTSLVTRLYCWEDIPARTVCLPGQTSYHQHESHVTLRIDVKLHRYGLSSPRLE